MRTKEQWKKKHIEWKNVVQNELYKINNNNNLSLVH